LAAGFVSAAAEPAHARLLAFLQAKHRARTARVATVGHPITRGETIVAILERYGVPTAEAQELYATAKPAFDLRRLVAGRPLKLGFTADQRLVSLRYQVDDERQLRVRRRGRGFTASIESLPYQVRAVGSGGVIESSFYAAARRAGVPDPVISRVVDLLAWKIDFSTEVHAGDRFRVLYEERILAGGRGTKPGRVLAADFNGRSGTASAFFYENDRGETTYLDADGRILDGGLLRYPLDFTRITSAFSHSRFHPILKRRRPHLGVDFAAPFGTPVRAVGAGFVRSAGTNGGFGRHVEIDHGGGLVSAYSHLRAIQPSLRAKARVERGQLIGWVGRTGLATGPHLHFAIFDRGKYVNPLRFRGTAQITQIDDRQFARVRAALGKRLRQLAGTRAASSTPPVTLSALAQARRLGPVAFTL
jgi:murein DD-endopeptidase MepM/ murein hydrolase activator NlpD